MIMCRLRMPAPTWSTSILNTPAGVTWIQAACINHAAHFHHGSFMSMFSDQLEGPPGRRPGLTRNVAGCMSTTTWQVSHLCAQYGKRETYDVHACMHA